MLLDSFVAGALLVEALLLAVQVFDEFKEALAPEDEDQKPHLAMARYCPSIRRFDSEVEESQLTLVGLMRASTGPAMRVRLRGCSGWLPWAMTDAATSADGPLRSRDEPS